MAQQIGDISLAMLGALVRDLLRSVDRIDLYDDVFQEASLAAWRAIETYDASKGVRLRTWQYRRAKFGAVDGLRMLTHGYRKVRDPERVSLDELTPDDPYLEQVEPGYDEVEDRQIYAWLGREIKTVWPAGCTSAAVAHARMVESRHWRDIQGEFGTSESRTSQVVRRTRMRLLDRWSAYGGLSVVLPGVSTSRA